jgi:hypothetical protein
VNLNANTNTTSGPAKLNKDLIEDAKRPTLPPTKPAHVNNQPTTDTVTFGERRTSRRWDARLSQLLASAIVVLV